MEKTIGNKINATELILGIAVLAGAILLGASKLAGPMLVFRLIIGLSLGYVLARAYTGFAGSVNRAYNGGSTRLMRAMTMMFFVSSLIVAGLLMFNKNEAGEAIISYGLWINPINMGLILGGLLFGFGMTFSSCCASGVMTDLVTDLPKAVITLVFFAMGVFMGTPLQNTANWINTSWFNSASYENGVFLPDVFASTPLNGFLGAIVFTGIMCVLVVAASHYYESYRKRTNTYNAIPSETRQYKLDNLSAPTKKEDIPHYLYRRVFVDPWTLEVGALLITILFGIMFAVTKGGWGASGPYGIWFGKALNMMGVSGESLAAFTKGKPDPYLAPFFANGVTVQNIGIILGALVYMLTSGQMAQTAKEFFSYPKWQYPLFVLGGFSMGFGTRLSNGCNVGALYSPIASFSLSGWIFFAFLVIGGIIGNTVQKKIFQAAKSGK